MRASIAASTGFAMFAVTASYALIVTAFAQDAQQKPEAPASTPASEPTEPAFMRFVDEGDGVGRLETAIVKYVDDQGREVDLIGAVHVGEPAYYKRLNDEFKEYDALLYEMVKPKDAVVKPGQEGDSLLSTFQRGIKWALGLEFQLDGIDYQAENFVHADLTPKEFMDSMHAKGESFLTMFWNLFTTQLKNSATMDPKNQPNGAAMLAAFLSKDRARHLKYIVGKQMTDLEQMAAGFEKGPNGGSTLVVERNKRALEVMKEQLDQGKRKLGIFYGAAHFPDMEKRLVGEHGFKKKETRWLTAWDIPQLVKP